MRSRIIVIAIAVMIIAGCSSPATGPGYFSSSDTLRPPPPGMAQLIIYYPSSFFWSGITANIETRGQAVCGLKSGTFTVRDIKPGPRTVVTASLCSTNGTSRLVINAVVGARYYVRVMPNDQTVTGLIARHGLSAVRTPNPTSAPTATTAKGPIVSDIGVFWVDLMKEPSALRELQGLKLCPGCS